MHPLSKTIPRRVKTADMPHHEPRMYLLPDEFTHLDILILEIKEVRVTIVRHIAMVTSGGTIVEETE